MNRTTGTTNMMIRKVMREHGLYQYQLADILNVNEGTICRWFRHELPEDEQKRIVSLIEEKAAK